MIRPLITDKPVGRGHIKIRAVLFYAKECREVK